MRRAFAALALAATASAQGMKIQISGAERARYKIAAPRPLGDADLAAELEDALAMDFRMVGLFDVLDPRGFLAKLDVEGMGIAAPDWTSVGAQGVIKARVTRVGGDAALEARFYEVARPLAPAVERTDRAAVADVRRLAHRFANDVYRHLTGEDGPFLTRILYVRPSGRAKDIVAVDVDGHRPTVLVANGADNVLPAWAPGGDRIAWTSLLWLNPDLFEARLGARPRRLSRHAGLNIGAAFSPDGRTIALTLSKDGNAEIYLVRAADGEILARLTDHPGIDASPSFSPDGAQLAFVSNRQGSPQIWVMPASGGAAKRVTFQGNYNQSPRFSPRSDVSQIAFTGRDERGRFDVFVLDLAAGTTQRVTQNQGDNWEPTWAPGGRLLAFASSRGGIWVATPDGQHQAQIVKGAAETPVWSPMRK
ncbi:MAG: translocation protein TolB [Myxococcota bacterium]